MAWLLGLFLQYIGFRPRNRHVEPNVEYETKNYSRSCWQIDWDMDSFWLRKGYEVIEVDSCFSADREEFQATYAVSNGQVGAILKFFHNSGELKVIFNFFENSPSEFEEDKKFLGEHGLRM